MKLKLTYVEEDFRGKQHVIREEFLEGESTKPITKGRAAKLINRVHPEYWPLLVDASDFPAEWLVHVEQKDSNCWLYVYASRVSSN